MKTRSNDTIEKIAVDKIYATDGDRLIAGYDDNNERFSFADGIILIDNYDVAVEYNLDVYGSVLMETHDGASLRMSDIIELEGEEVVISCSTFFNDGVVGLPTYSTLDRPAESVDGAIIYDTTLGLPIVWNGTKWIKFDGTDA